MAAPPLFALALAACTATPPPPPPPPLADTWWVQVRRAAWAPRDVDYLLRLAPPPAEPGGRVALDPTVPGPAAALVRDVQGSADALSLTLVDAGRDGSIVLDGHLRGGLWTGTHSWHDGAQPQVDAFVAHPRTVLRLEGSPDSRLPDAPDPAAQGLDPLLLDRLVLAAEEARSDHLVVVAGGRVVARRHFGGDAGPASIQSITKPIAALALGLLQAEGRLGSVDTPVAQLLPGLAADPAGAVTLRHLLTHTSGLDPAGTPALNGAADRLRFSLRTPRLRAPGETAAYNNRAFNLISGVIQGSAGEGPAAYLGPRLFVPLGLDSVAWSTDAHGANPVYVGLTMTAQDLAVLGHTLADGGRWRGTQVVPAAWMAAMLQPSFDAAPRRGLSWALRPDPTTGALLGFGHTGSQGQQLWIYPEADLVVVRLIALTDTSWGVQEERDALHTLAPMADALARDALLRRGRGP